jgi:thioredoxin 1
MIEVTDETYRKEVIEEKGKVLAYYWRPNCSQCEVMDKVFETVKLEGVKLVKIDGDKFPSLRAGYSVRQSPFLVLWEDGKRKAIQAGACDAQRLVEFLTEEEDQLDVLMKLNPTNMSQSELKIAIWDLRKYGDPIWEKVKQMENSLKERQVKAVA